jgi:hypothetical protein
LAFLYPGFLGAGILCLASDLLVGFVVFGAATAVVDFLLWGTPEVRASDLRFGSAAVATVFARDPVEAYLRDLGVPPLFGWARYLLALVPFAVSVALLW